MTQEQINKVADEYVWAHDTIGIDKHTLQRDCPNVMNMVRVSITDEIRNAVMFGIKYALSNQWISVDNELPERLEGENVSDYVYVTNGNWYEVMRYEFNYKIWLDYANGRHWGITHWMEIPKLKEK